MVRHYRASQNEAEPIPAILAEGFTFIVDPTIINARTATIMGRYCASWQRKSNTNTERVVYLFDFD